MINGIETIDYKLTRFACYLIAMNGDPKKPEVAMVQAYFATQTRQFELYVENNTDVERLLIRDEIAEGNKSKLFDTMGRTELAANLFRITQTEERIKSKNIKGQMKLEQTHFSVGREVRNIIQKH